MNPKVSFIMPVYNQARFLKESIVSILSQSSSGFEFLILDDASTDDSLKIAKNFKDKRIKIYQNKRQKGLAKSLNFLIGKARGEYIARMDGDDVSFPHRLKEQVDFLNENKQIVLVGCWAEIINKEGKTIGSFKYPQKHKEIRQIILIYNPFVHSSVLFRKKALEQVGGYNQYLFYSQDYDLFLKLVAKYQSANIGKILHKFRWLPNFRKQKKQHKTALKIRLKAIYDYGYNKLEIVKLVKPSLFYLVPQFIKKPYWQTKLS